MNLDSYLLKDYLHIVELRGIKFLLFEKDLNEQLLNFFPNNFYDKYSENKEKYIKIGDFSYILSELKIDFTSFHHIEFDCIDYILISNLENCLYIPFFTEAFNFKGKIVLNNIQFLLGKLYCTQFAIHAHKFNDKYKDFNSKIQYDNLEDYLNKNKDLNNNKIKIHEFLKIYSEKDIEESFKKLTVINLNEYYQVKNEFYIYPISSGFEIGANIWNFKSYKKRVSFLKGISNQKYRNGIPLNINYLDNSNFIINLPIIKKPNDTFMVKNLSSSEYDIKDILLTIKDLLKLKNQNIILPFQSIFLILDLFISIINNYFNLFKHIIIVSENADKMIKIININIEYLNEVVMNSIFMKNPQLPFDFDTLKLKNKLKFFKNAETLVQSYKNNLNDIKNSIIFVEDFCFRIGNFVDLFDFINKPNNNVVFTDPHINYEKLISPFSSFIEFKIIKKYLNCYNLLGFWRSIDKNKIYHFEDNNIYNYYNPEISFELNIINNKDIFIENNILENLNENQDKCFNIVEKNYNLYLNPIEDKENDIRLFEIDIDVLKQFDNNLSIFITELENLDYKIKKKIKLEDNKYNLFLVKENCLVELTLVSYELTIITKNDNLFNEILKIFTSCFNIN